MGRDLDNAPSVEGISGKPVEEERVRRKSLVREYGEAIVIAILLALVIRTFVVQAFTIPSGSMLDTLLVGDYILVNKFIYGAEIPYASLHLPGIRRPNRGDIIVFKYPQDEKRDFIKRVVAIPGDTVQVRDNRVLLNGQMLDEPYVRPGSVPAASSNHCSGPYACEPLVVPPDSYFLMGDNRDNSQDSRVLSAVGYVPFENLVGRAQIIFFSVAEGEQTWHIWRWPWTVRWSRLFTLVR